MAKNNNHKMRVVAVKESAFEYVGPAEVTRILFENQERNIRQLSDAEITRLLERHPQFSVYFKSISKPE